MDILRPESSNSNPSVKRCYKCKQIKPATTEFFYQDKSKKDGLWNKCKTCDQANKVRKPRVSQIVVPDGQKICSRCKETFPATPEFFQRDKHRKDGLYSYCKGCVKEQNHTPESREKKHIYNQEYLNRPGMRDQINARRRDDYHDNPETREKALAYNKLPDVREYQRAYLKVYNKTPKGREKNRANKHKYRARQKTVAGTYTDQQIRDLLKRQKYKCYYCGKKFEKVDGKYVYNVEHTFPISRVAGTDIPANDISYLVLACYPCNRDKGNKFPWEFPQGGRLL